jgi:endonuclease-8
MPEGPEVRLQSHLLKKRLVNKNIFIEILRGRYTRHTLKNLNKVSFPIKVKDVLVKGKLIYITFHNSETTLFITLGMSGHFLEKNNEESVYTSSKHNNIAIRYNTSVIYFHDYRNFGTFQFTLTKEDQTKKLQKIGIDLLDPKTTFDDFYKILIEKRNHKKIGEILLEQKYFSGIGNYIRSDSLYLAKICPFTLVKNLTKENIKSLFHWIRVVLFFHYDVSLGLQLKIISQKDLSILNKKGNKGEYFNFDFIVYNQKKDPLGNTIIRTKDSKNRTIHWCKEVQII